MREIAKVDLVIRSASGGDSLGEERVGLGRRVELERVSGIGDTDDPLAESQEPVDQ